MVFSRALKLSLLGVLLGTFCPSHAEVYLQDARTWSRAKLVAPGQQVWSFQSSYQNVSDRFSTNGQIEALGAKHSRAVTWGQLLRAESSQVGKADLEKEMRRQGVSESEIAATSAYKMNREEIGFGVDWAYGLTRRWMIGFQVPLVLRTTTVRSSVKLQPKLAKATNQSSQSSVLSMNNAQVQERVKDLAQQELSNSGYDSVPDQKQSWEWGDVSLLSQFYLAQGRSWRWALQQTMRFPTSRNPSVSDYLQQTSDDGQLDLGVTSLTDFRVRRWTMGMRAGFVAQLPDSAKMRVPESGAQTSKTPIDPKVHRDLGDWVWASLDGDYRISRHLGLDLEQAFLSKGKDRYKGESLNGTGYSSLGRDTNQEIHQTRIGVLYDLGESSSRRGIENKWVASVGYTYPWVGRNSSDASRASLELISYF